MGGRREARTRLNEIVHQIDKGAFVSRSSLTFEEFADKWLEGRRSIRGSTEAGYASIINAQLIPRIGSVHLSAKRYDWFNHVDALVGEMIEDELEPKTIRNVVVLLRTMLAGRKTRSSAIQQGLIAFDPTTGVELPQVDTREVTPPTPESAWKLINAAKEIGGIGYPLAYLAAFTGVRRGEALALRFSDIRWFDKEVHVQRAISKHRGRDGAHKWEWREGPPKSKKSVRRIAATESVMKLLADLKAGKSDDAYLFPGDHAGGFIDPDKFDLEVWKPITERAEMAGTRFHDLRHFFASQLIGQGETAAYVRDQMGHSSIKVTFDTYGHLFPGRGKEASSKYEKAMQDARQKAEEKATSEASPESPVRNPLGISAGDGSKPI
jgi:integrase